MQLEAVGTGTIGWIIRADQAWGHVAGCLAVDGDPYAVKEKGGPVWYAEGTIFPWPREWWIDGARLHVGGWTGAPFGLTRGGKRAARFQSGVTLNRPSLDLIGLALVDKEADRLDKAADEFGAFFDHLRRVGLRGFVAEKVHPDPIADDIATLPQHRRPSK